MFNTKEKAKIFKNKDTFIKFQDIQSRSLKLIDQNPRTFQGSPGRTFFSRIFKVFQGAWEPCNNFMYRISTR
jgi:hypothetical protein